MKAKQRCFYLNPSGSLNRKTEVLQVVFVIKGFILGTGDPMSVGGLGQVWSSGRLQLGEQRKSPTTLVWTTGVDRMANKHWKQNKLKQANKDFWKTKLEGLT